ncbi:MAG: alpha-glucan family phosphorylase [Burkholderiales bacterium]|nr:alpha-glucan family phosphorylase [Burkholderiales bacterium]
MRGTPFRLDVRPELPASLKRLEELANNLWYSWDRATRTLFARLDPELWQRVGHSPKAFLRNIDQKRLREASDDPKYLSALQRVLAAYDAYHGEALGANHAPHMASGDLIAYFCAEFGLHESLPIYSGGLGILAGDHCKTASDLRLPFVGVGLLYRQGYFQQQIDNLGQQVATYADTEFDMLPIEPVRRADGGELRVSVGLPGRETQVKLWRARIGHVALVLLDTDVEENSEHDRDIAHRLYTGDRERRLEQEVILGIGGVRALDALGIAPNCWHINEGHPAFMIVERVRRLMLDGLDYDSALEAVAASTVFTTHTVVPAGHDHFPEVRVRAHLKAALPEAEGQLERLLALGASGGAHEFNMTTLAVRGSRHQNGVSRIHAQVSARLCAELWPQIEVDENPVGCVTNGVHVPTFLADAWQEAFEHHLGAGWSQRLTDPACWRQVDTIPDAQFWNIHQGLKAQMLHLVRYRIREQNARNQGSEAHLDRIFKLADPANPTVLTIGFARRFATYKRATLLFQNLDWLREIVANPERPPVLFIFAGKAHPADEPGQALIRRIAELARTPELEGRLLLVEGYDLRLGRRLVNGVDVWLNNPIYPMEACGTSGMKAAINGALNLSVLDGWWAEGYNGRNGWAIKPASQALDAARRDAEEARTLYELLQDQVIPTYYATAPGGYSPAWVQMAKESMASIGPRFSSMRMLADYIDHLYRPAARQGRRLADAGFRRAHALAAWKTRVRTAWDGIALRAFEPPTPQLGYGGTVHLAVAAALNGLAPQDVVIEVVFARPGTLRASEAIDVKQLNYERTLNETGEHLYSIEFCPQISGRFEYRIRAYPSSPLLTHPFEMGMMTWL